MSFQAESTTNRYDASIIHRSLVDDIGHDKWIALFLMIFSFSMVSLLLPLGLFLLASMVMYADLPIVDHYLIYMFRTTPFVCFPFSFALIFYFFSISYEMNDKKEPMYQRALRLLIITLIVGCLPLLIPFGRYLLLALYAVLFVITFYSFSTLYIQFQEQNRSLSYQPHDLGIYGIIDNPFSVQDDINRAKLAVNTGSIGLFFVEMFSGLFWSNLVYFIAIRQKKHILSATHFLDQLFENKMHITQALSNIYALKILTYKGYLEVTFEGTWEITSKCKALAQKAKHIKE